MNADIRRDHIGILDVEVIPPELRKWRARMLRQELQATADGIWSQWPAADRQQFEAAATRVRASDVLRGPVQAGEMVPDFALENADGKIVDLQVLLDRGPVVLTFFLSAASPLCRLAVCAYHQAVRCCGRGECCYVAISLQPAMQAAAWFESANIASHLLGDPQGHVCGLFGLLYPVPDDLHAGLQKIGVDIGFCRDRSPCLPLVASYVIDCQGSATFVELDADPVRRPEPEMLIAALCQITSGSPVG